MKEAVYKAIETRFNRYISYKEIEIYPRLDGTASVIKKLNEPNLSFESIAQWSKFEPDDDLGAAAYWISCVKAHDFTQSEG